MQQVEQKYMREQILVYFILQITDKIGLPLECNMTETVITVGLVDIHLQVLQTVEFSEHQITDKTGLRLIAAYQVIF